jgi:hypothetical protein
MTRYKLFREIFFDQKEFMFFKLIIFVKNFVKFLKFSEKFYFNFISDPELPGYGSGMITSGYESGYY